MLTLLAAALFAQAPVSGPSGTDEDARGATSVTLAREELEAVPAFVSGSFAALPLLPGASPLLSPVAVSSMRGKQPATVGVYVDGVEVPSAFHLLVGPGAVQDAVVERLTYERFLTPIEGGRHLGGALRIDVPQALEPGVHGTTSLDLLRLGTLEHWGSADAKTQVSAGASLAWTPFVYTRAASGGLRADLWDYYARAEHAFGNARLRLLALGSVDDVRSASQTDVIGAGLTFHRVDARARLPVWGGTGEAGATFGWDRVRGELGGHLGQTEAMVTQTTFSARASWMRALGESGELRAGADVSRRAADLAQYWTVKAPEVDGAEAGSPLEVGVRTPVANALLSGAWAEVRLSGDPSSRWTLGLRVDDYHLAPGRDLLAAEPRVTVWRALSEDVSVHAGAGLVHQAPTFLLPLPGVDLTALRHGLQEALRFDGGVRVALAPHTTAALDGYVDSLTRMIELSPLDRDFLQTVKAPAQDVTAKRGFAYGAELLLRREWSGGWFGWLSWTWQRSERETTYVRRNDYGEPFDSATAVLPVGFVQEHAASVVGGRTFGRWTVSGAAQFHTGALEAGGLSSTTQREGLDRLRPGPKWIEADQADWEFLPPFFRVDARVAYAFALGPARMTASLDVQNVAFGREVIKYGYSEEADSLADRDAGKVRLSRTPGSLLPALPLPMLGLTARY